MAQDFCKIVIVDDQQCLVQIILDDDYALHFTMEHEEVFINGTLKPISSLEKARELLAQTDERICKEICGDIIDKFKEFEEREQLESEEDLEDILHDDNWDDIEEDEDDE